MAHYLAAVVAKIALIDDDSVSVAQLSETLTRDGHQVSVSDSVETAMKRLVVDRPDLIILELAVGGSAGRRLCRAVKQNPVLMNVAIVIVTKLVDEIDRVVAFEMGVDDYVTKPFSAREIGLRVRGVLRRASVPASEAPVQCGRIKIDRFAHRAWVDDRPVELSRLEFKILLHLCEHRNRVLSRDILVQNAWGPGESVSARTVDAYVKRLRQKLGTARHSIETVRGVGYRLSVRDEHAPF